ncbi:MAG: Nif11-like leader peptide family natural product precursor [Alphaproteobacteria bacterium]|nr:Nif11-like leader peptide family natural product precursor [Alphaproteobacteria bacterium]MBU0797217.1 Nif11-like leader peptide family natural product precursor [Alphaproteobacteria bacterium]MBU0888995.1 Nif11-like leader peptide family natural product precursor [Alphaproteobacteria bacterium]MBU1814015.1 Nif11-like leader peptide family natural product precursor [Alphaproteobacteria bacterium]MBU2092112.1 Nif11-like leader peptide family natural product precursor [Alphaproteobacteria bact
MSAEFEKLKALVQSDESYLATLSRLTEVGDVAAALAVLARENGIGISAEQIKQQMTANDNARPDDELDDAALEAVSGGGSPWCMATKGCYCIFTK